MSCCASLSVAWRSFIFLIFSGDIPSYVFPRPAAALVAAAVGLAGIDDFVRFAIEHPSSTRLTRMHKARINATRPIMQFSRVKSTSRCPRSHSLSSKQRALGLRSRRQHVVTLKCI